MNRCLILFVLVFALEGSVAVRKTRGDEGMWLLNDAPQTMLKKRYGFELTADWLEHARKASARGETGLSIVCLEISPEASETAL